MPYDPERIRKAIRRIQRERKLKMAKWAELAGKGERTLSEFLAGRGNSPTVETLYAFADAAGVEITDIMGLEPVKADLSASAYRTMLGLLQRIDQSRAEDSDALSAVRDLARALEAQLGR